MHKPPFCRKSDKKKSATTGAQNILRTIDGHVIENDWFKWFIAVITAHSGNLANEVNAFNHFAEYGMMAIEVGCRDFGDKELRAVGIWACIRHREDTRRIMAKFIVEFVTESVTGATSSRSAGAAALNHELRDNSVKDNAVIERTSDGFASHHIDEIELSGSESDEILNGIWDEVFVELSDHIAHRRFETRIKLTVAGDGNISEILGIDE